MTLANSASSSSPFSSFLFLLLMFYSLFVFLVIYIALLSSRVPIVPSIYGYAGQLGGPLVTSPLLDLPFSSMFDLPRLFDHLHREHGLAGIIEWKDLVNVTKGDAYDKWNATSDWVDVSCWNAFVPPFQDPMRTLRLSESSFPT